MPASMPMAIRRWTGPASLAAAGIRTDTTSALVQGERLVSRRRLQWDPPALQQARPRHRDGDRPEQRLKAVFQDSAPVRPGLLRWLPARRRPAASRRTPPAAWAIRCRCSSGVIVWTSWGRLEQAQLVRLALGQVGERHPADLHGLAFPPGSGSVSATCGTNENYKTISG